MKMENPATATLGDPLVKGLVMPGHTSSWNGCAGFIPAEVHTFFFSCNVCSI